MKFTMADDIKIQVGDILQLVPMKEWEELKVEFADKEQQRRLAGNKVRVIEVNAEDETLLEYLCEELNGERVHTSLFDSDIEYVVRPTRKYLSVFYKSKGTKRLKAVEQIESDNISKVEVIPLGDWHEFYRTSHFGFIIDTAREDIELSDIIYRNGASSIYLSDEKDMEKQKQLYEKIKSW